MTSDLDLTAVGIGSHAGAPVAPPSRWSRRRVSAHSIVKAHRVWMAAVEPFAFALGLTGDEVARLRPLLLVLGTTVYEWDEETERDVASSATDHAGHASVLEELVSDVVRVDDDMRADVLRLRRLFELEQELVGRVDAGEAFSAMARCRSADLQLFMRVVMQLSGRVVPGVVDVMRPCHEVLEVVDDLETVTRDRASGSFNSYNLLRDAYGPAEARERLDRFAAERTAEFAAAFDAADDEVSRLVLVLCGRPASHGVQRILAAAAGTPRVVRRQLFRSLVLPRLRTAFAPYWQRSGFRDDV